MIRGGVSKLQITFFFGKAPYNIGNVDRFIPCQKEAYFRILSQKASKIHEIVRIVPARLTRQGLSVL